MTWSYNLATISTTPKDQVRLMIGDTVTTDQLLQDEEISWALTQEGSTYLAGARCCELVASHYGRQVNRSVGQMKLDASKRVEQYIKLAKRLRAQAVTENAGYAGGISVSDKQNNTSNSDRVNPMFWVAEQDNPSVNSPSDAPVANKDGSV